MMPTKSQFNSWSVLSHRRTSIQSNLSSEDVDIDISSLCVSEESMSTQTEGKASDLSSLMHIPAVAQLLASERKAKAQLQRELEAAKRSAAMAMESKAKKEDELARKVKVLQYKQKVANDQMMDMHAELSAFKQNSPKSTPPASPIRSKVSKPIQPVMQWRRKTTNSRFGNLVSERKPLSARRFNNRTRFPSNESSPSRFPSSPKQGRFPTSPKFCAPANKRVSPQSSKSSGEHPHNSKGQPIVKRPQDLPFEMAKRILANSKGFGPCWGHFGIQGREAHSCYRPTFKNAAGHLRCVYGSHVNLGGCWEVTK